MEVKSRKRSARRFPPSADASGDDYWLKRDREGGSPEDFYAAFAADGWLGICIPEAYGGAGSASPKPRS